MGKPVGKRDSRADVRAKDQRKMKAILKGYFD